MTVKTDTKPEDERAKTTSESAHSREESYGEWARKNLPDLPREPVPPPSEETREGRADAKPRPRERPGFRNGAPGRVPNAGSRPYESPPEQPRAYERPYEAPRERPYEPPRERSYEGSVGRKPPKGVTVESFAAATLLFAANLAVYLKFDRKTFLKSAATAFDYITRENSKRKGVEAESEEPPPPKAPSDGDT